jgi:hypothetical protein
MTAPEVVTFFDSFFPGPGQSADFSSNYETVHEWYWQRRSN